MTKIDYRFNYMYRRSGFKSNRTTCVQFITRNLSKYNARLTLIMVQIQGQVVEAKANLWKINSIEPIAMMMCNAIERNKTTDIFLPQGNASVTWKLATNNSPNAARRPNAKDNLLAVIQRDFSAGVKDICVIIRRTYWNRISALRATETEN